MSPTQNCSSFFFFFFSKPSAKIADAGKLLWTQTSYIVFVWVQVYHWLPENIVAWEFYWHWEFVYIVECHLIIAPPLPVMPILMATACSSFCWTSWLSILSYNIDKVLTAIDFCSVLHTALLSHYMRNCWPVRVTWWLLGLILHRSQSVLLYTGDLFFPLLSVYASCSSSIRYNIHFSFYKLSLIAMSLAAWVTQAQILRKCFKRLLSSFLLCF